MADTSEPPVDRELIDVTISHPDFGGTALVSRAAFDEVWAENGWVEDPDAEPPAAAVTAVDRDDTELIDDQES